MNDILKWLLKGDVSLQYQVHRDLLGEDREDLQRRILKEGWGARFMAAQNPDGHWGRGFYQPKWTSSHYTLLDIKKLQPIPEQPKILATIENIASERKAADGGINPAKTIEVSDVCVNGMYLDYACYFGLDGSTIESVVDYLLVQQMEDGGFNCERERYGAVHSSLHSTICVVEGILQYRRNNYRYRLEALLEAAAMAEEFILQHQLFRSDRTGEIIHRDMLRLSFPPRWKYDILRALDYFRAADHPWDERMRPAIEVLRSKIRADGRWPLQANHPGKLHFEMEKPGGPSRWNTLRALRVLDHFPQAAVE